MRDAQRQKAISPPFRLKTLSSEASFVRRREWPASIQSFTPDVDGARQKYLKGRWSPPCNDLTPLSLSRGAPCAI